MVILITEYYRRMGIDEFHIFSLHPCVKLLSYPQVVCCLYVQSLTLVFIAAFLPDVFLQSSECVSSQRNELPLLVFVTTQNINMVIVSVSLGDLYFMAAIQYCSPFRVKRNTIVEDVKGLFYKTVKKHTRNHVFSSEKTPTATQPPQNIRHDHQKRELLFTITFGFFTQRKKVSSKRSEVLCFSYGVLKKCTAPKDFEMCAMASAAGCNVRSPV